jgi:peptidoglycan/LPS O-acetylase OafA/YrhL
MLVVLVIGAVWLIFLGPIHTFAAISFGYTWLALMYACILMLAVVPKGGLVKSIAALFPLRMLGILAYGLYLFHQAVNGVVHGLFRNQVPSFRTPLDALAAVIAFVLTFSLAHLSWTYFEKPLVALGHRFAKYEISPPVTLTPELGIDSAA